MQLALAVDDDDDASIQNDVKPTFSCESTKYLGAFCGVLIVCNIESILIESTMSMEQRIPIWKMACEGEAEKKC